MLAHIDDRDVSALSGEQGGNAAADAAVGAGDQRDLALQAIRALESRLPIGLGLELAFVPRQPVFVDHRLHDFGHHFTPWARRRDPRAPTRRWSPCWLRRNLSSCR